MRAINTVLDYDQMEFEISYTKWLMETFSEPSVEEINKMEEDFFKSSAVSSRSLSLKPLNNPYYQPIIGA